jgi:hypothetical protein
MRDFTMLLDVPVGRCTMSGCMVLARNEKDGIGFFMKDGSGGAGYAGRNGILGCLSYPARQMKMQSIHYLITFLDRFPFKRSDCT